jgi:hypothetical protein
MNPVAWPLGDALFSIFSLKHGGAFERRRGRSFVVPPHFWTREALNEPSLVVVLRDLGLRFEVVSRVTLSSSEESAWRAVGAQSFRVDAGLREPSLLDWSREVFVSALREAGEPVWLRVVREYEAELPPQAASLDSLRFLPAFLRSRGHAFAATAALEWARVQALFSPQDDRRVDGLGGGADVYLNPTHQVVTVAGEMLALWRIDGQLCSQPIGWEKAAILDELRESPRMSRAGLLHELEARAFRLEAAAPFSEIVSSMLEDGLLLAR